MVMTVERDTSLPVPDVVAMGAVQQIVVLGQRQLVGDFQPDGFARIERRSAAHAHDSVAAVLLVAGEAIEHVALSGVGFHGGEDHGAGRQTRDPLEDRSARETRVCDQQRTGNATLAQFLRQAADRARAEQYGGGETEGSDSHNHHESTFC
jgi:hypothetical protein